MKFNLLLIPIYLGLASAAFANCPIVGKIYNNSNDTVTISNTPCGNTDYDKVGYITVSPTVLPPKTSVDYSGGGDWFIICPTFRFTKDSRYCQVGMSSYLDKNNTFGSSGSCNIKFSSLGCQRPHSMTLGTSGPYDITLHQ